VINTWKNEVFGNVNELVLHAGNHFQVTHEPVDILGHTDALLEQQKDAQISLDNSLDMK